MKEIEVAHLDEEDQRISEKVPAEPLGGKRYRLGGSPGIVAGLAAGDEIELDPKEPTGYRLIKRGMNVAIQIHLARCNEATRKTVAQIVEKVGGWLDGSAEQPGHCILVCTIPVFVTFAVIEKAMDDVARKCRIEGWSYGNVYDPADGVTPLNWWPE